MIGAEGLMGRVARIGIGVLVIVGVILGLRDVRLEFEESGFRFPGESGCQQNSTQYRSIDSEELVG